MVTTLKDEQPKNVIAICTPNLNGLFSTRAMLSHTGVGTPLNTSTVRLVVEGKPVDEARNELVELAKQHRAKYLLFLDDDTLPPQFALLRLLGLLAKNKKTGKRAMVATGVYYTKSLPAMPVLLKKDVPGGYDDWEVGDIFDVDYIGMGCCLIDMRLFDELEKPYFNYTKGSPDPAAYQGTIGEDVWFCEQVLKAGHKIWVDSLIQCEHEDKASNMSYFHWNESGTGACRDKEGIIRYFPPAGDPARPDPGEKALADQKLCWGYVEPPEGFTLEASLVPEEIRRKYKDIEDVMIRDTIERVLPETGVKFMSRIVRSMKNDSKITVEVPDFPSIARGVADKSDERFMDALFGEPGKRYKSFFTVKGLTDTMSGLGVTKDTTVENVDGKLIFSGVK